LSFAVGLATLTSLGFAAGTFSQPVSAAGAGVSVGELASSLSPPPHAASSRAQTSSSATGKGSLDMRADDNDRRVPLSALARRYRHFLLDLDGCLYVGDSPTERAAEALTALREASKGIVFLTNEVGSSPEEIVRKLWRLGFQASLDEVMTAGAALQFMLAARGGGGGAAFVSGSQALVDHVAEAGLRIVNNTEFATRADIVVVADHERFNYGELRIATQAVLRGAELIGLTRDRTFPMPDGQWPGSGAVLAAVETASGHKADEVVGKPEPAMYEAARDRLGEGKILAVGDRLDADVLGAKRAGFDSALVLTGVTDRSQIDGAKPAPTHVADSLAALLLT
jgi:HAD superfamily hydrolase (TIGR01450 family)